MAARRRGSKEGRRKRAAIAPAFPRLGWSRSPVQHPHSTKKGARGYDRARAKRDLRRERKESGR